MVASKTVFPKSLHNVTVEQCSPRSLSLTHSLSRTGTLKQALSHAAATGHYAETHIIHNNNHNKNFTLILTLPVKILDWSPFLYWILSSSGNVAQFSCQHLRSVRYCAIGFVPGTASIHAGAANGGPTAVGFPHVHTHTHTNKNEK